ncbi:hypothetical protein [Thioalkalivibrio sp. ALJT]|uniref:hypothetical protein n=1 Tax=Thioalkalivibrio sp. ALJT TaxID=1158146 RepID=UPI00036CE5BD|nr:hypothetical protein [Thioalkalivibrio sp. ALJT]
MSVYDGDQISPLAAHAHYTGTLGHLSIGVMGVYVRECAELELPVCPDPDPFPEHAVIDFSDLGRKAIERKAKQLRARAEQHDWLHRESLTG